MTVQQYYQTFQYEGRATLEGRVDPTGELLPDRWIARVAGRYWLCRDNEKASIRLLEDGMEMPRSRPWLTPGRRAA